jgi:Family of unknown function (DUF6029)
MRLSNIKQNVYLFHFYPILALSLLLLAGSRLSAQDSKGTISGSFQSDFQYYIKDSVSTKFNTLPPPQHIGSNSYFTLLYQQGNLKIGARYESYLPAMLGYPAVFNGQGIANRFVSYQIDDLEVTVGNFYEQFGSGMVLRSQEQRQLGLDNAFDGVRLKYFWKDKAKIVGLAGKQRDGFIKGEGEVKGLDAEIYLDRVLAWKGTVGLTLGASYVSRFQGFSSGSIVPQNANAMSGRLGLTIGNFHFESEYVHKTSDPGTLNGGFLDPNLAEGNGFLTNISYSTKRVAILLGFKKVYNMDFRSERSAIDNRLQINFVPVNTTQHTYRLLTIYPYATQVLGEYAFQADIIYNLPKNTALGGEYGATLSLNYALANNLDNTNQWRIGSKTYFQDFNIEISKKWSKKWRTTLKYVNLHYDANQIEGRPIGIVKSNTIIIDNLYKISTKNSLKIELQHLSTDNDRGNWAFALVEFSRSPSWSVFASDELNYGKINADIPVHYYNVGAAYIKGANRFSLSYGRQRYGLICVGGICRLVPAYSGLSFSVTSRF